MRIIAVGHHKGVGKDAFIRFCMDVLKAKYPKSTIARRGFADKLYDFCFSVYGWAGFKSRQYYVDNPAQKEIILPKLGKTPRQILIDVGNKMREYDPNIWLNANLKEVNCDFLFVSDCRYPNEFEPCYNEGAITVLMKRPNLPKPTDVADCALDSETRWHVTIDNDGDLNKLYKLAKDFIAEHFHEKDLK